MLRVLLVEDSVGDAVLVREELADVAPGAVQLTVARTLAEACASVEAEPFDCVLLDLTLPDAFELRGLEALRDQAPDLPVVVLSGLGRDELAIRAVKAGAQDYLVKGETSAALLLRAVRHAIERKQAERRLATLAMSDALTGLPNRALLLERAHLALDRMRADTASAGGLVTGSSAMPRPLRPVGLLFLDLDRFKLVNDSLGHAAGDELLVGVGRRLRDAVRRGDTVARFGGDEFAVLCESVDDAAELDALAARLTAVLSEPMHVAGTEIFPSASIGVAAATGHDDSPERLLREADAAMYGAKAGGRATAELHQALRRGELVLHYQPVVRLGERDGIAAVEALVRWRHPERGPVGPDEYIGTAEDTGLIRRLGAWVLQEGCRQLAAWDAAGVSSDVTLAVKLSARQLADEQLVGIVAAALREHGLAPTRLCVEIGEIAGAPAPLAALRALGVQVAIDARSALAWATGAQPELPVDVVKLDRRFVGRMDEDASARRVVDAVLGLARSLGARVVAEGIEDDAQARELADLGCELGQGFAFAPASPAIAVEALLVRAGAARAAQIRVYLCDDAPALRHLLRSYLEWGGDVEIVGEAGDGVGLTAAVGDAAADVVLLDLSMPNVDGLEALADLRAGAPDLGIVVLSGFEERRMAAKALALGADRYVEKAAGMEVVRSSVRAVAAARRGARALAEAA